MKSIFTSEYESFIGKLIAARKAAGLTQQGLADQLGRPQSFVSKYERRERRLDVVEFVRVAMLLGIESSLLVKDIEQALTGHGKGKPKR